jgi:hypothetical protein
VVARRALRAGSIAVLLVLALGAGMGTAHAADELPAPTVVVTPSAPWVSESGWVESSWTSDDTTAIAGWAVTLDESPDSEPLADYLQSEPSWSSWLGDGIYWLHVRAVGLDGELGAVAHTRIAVDTEGPLVADLVSTSHETGSVSDDSSVDLGWSEAQDVSGVVGYQVVSGQFELPLDVAGEVTTTQTNATVELPHDGPWFLSVRAVDAAGLWGPFSTYAVLVDARGPGEPQVEGSHPPGVATSQRHLVANFTADAADDVVAWVATVDGSPSATLDPAAARPEPRLAATLEPGAWWLHVAGVDTAGRLGDVADVPLVIDAPRFALDVPAGRHLWAPTRLEASCPVEATATVQAVAADGTRSDVGPLVQADGDCSLEWDPTTQVDGARVWPDGDYQLVISEGGQDVSEAVTVRVATAEGAVERINAEYATGAISAAEQADLLIRALGDPTSLPQPYRADGVATAPEAATLLGALTADGEIPAALLADLTPTPVDTAGRADAAAGTGGLRSVGDVTPGCNESWRYLKAVYDCTAASDHFVLLYQSLSVETSQPEDELPATVERALTSLERARAVYEANGFATPSFTLVDLNPHLGNKGISLPAVAGVPTISMGVDDLLEYLPHHEYFHQVQYLNFITPQLAAARLLNATDIYWWVEATAEWGAHLVQTEDSSFPPTPTYASALDEFMANSANSLEEGSPSSAGGPEYGAFPLAEFLQQQYGVDAVRSTWSKIGGLLPPQTANQAIASVIADNGDSYARELHRFREWMYPLGYVDGWGGFTTDDAQQGEFWRDAIGGPRVRVPHTTATLDAVHRRAEGTVVLGAGGAAYVEIAGPRDLIGELTVHVSNGATATVIDHVGEFPALCSQNTGPTRADASASRSIRAELGSLYDEGCENALLVISYPAPPLPQLGTTPRTRTLSVDWSAEFAPDGVIVNNGTLGMGVHDTGALGYAAGGIAWSTQNGAAFSDGWSVSDPGMSETSFSSYFDTSGTVRPGAFTFDAARTTARSATTLPTAPVLAQNSLVVTHDVHPSSQPELFAVDVTVSRPEPLLPVEVPPVDGRVHYRRSTEWDVTWSRYSPEMLSTWTKLPEGDDSRLAGITHRYTEQPAPLTPSQQPLAYGESGTLYSAGGTLDLDLGVIEHGQSVSFTLYYGIAVDRAAADAAVTAVDADVSYLVYPTSWMDPQQSTTGIFAYRAHTPGS